MAKKEATVAPKERINVTFKPATGGASEEIELPLKVSVLGDFYQRHDPRPLEERRPIGVTKNNFTEVMSNSNLAIDVAVPNPLDKTEDATLPVHLQFKSLRDFEPESLVNQVPELRDMQNIRNALVSLKGPLGNLPAFKKALEEVLADSTQQEQLKREMEASGLNLDSFLESRGGSKSGKKPRDKKAEL